VRRRGGQKEAEREREDKIAGRDEG